jgi:phosphoglycolate phosphatase
VTGTAHAAVLFDLDGTLTNPRVGITRSVQFALGRLGVVVDDPEKLTPYIGPPLRVSFREFHGLSDHDAGTALAHYREYYERTGMFENEEYPGIARMLGLLKDRATALFVATSKPRVYAERILRHFELDSFFTAIEGSELDETRSNKAELIAWMIERHGLDRARCVMVGDRRHDAEGARSNGMDSIGVGYGFGSREELETAGVTYFVDSVERLGALLCGDTAR